MVHNSNWRRNAVDMDDDSIAVHNSNWRQNTVDLDWNGYRLWDEPVLQGGQISRRKSETRKI
jgi:hypothetical protein